MHIFLITGDVTANVQISMSAFQQYSTGNLNHGIFLALDYENVT